MPPPNNAVGFAPADWVLLFLTAVLLLAAFVWRPAVQLAVSRLAAQRRTCLAIFFLTPILLRMMLLPHHPVPQPDVYDEFSHLLLADTLLHGRLANPPHPLHQFFETFFVLQQPTYSSIYPCGMGIVLALGRLLFGIPWSGVLIVSGLLSASCYWMLRGWLTPVWSLFGATLAVTEFGPLCQWTNSYWGGSLAAVGGCLVFGALPRLRQYARKRDAVLLGTGFGIHLLCRQVESAFLLLSIALFFVPIMLNRRELRRLIRPLSYAILPLVPIIVLVFLQNRAVTGSWTMLPEKLSQYQYGVPTSMTVEPVVMPHQTLTREQQLDYKAQAMMHGKGEDSLVKFLLRLEYRVRLYRFFLLPPLYIALVAFLFSLGSSDMRWVVVTMAIFALGTNLFPYLLDHYLAAITCLFILMSITGLRQLLRLRIRDVHVGTDIVLVLIVLCGAQFSGWYVLHLFEAPAFGPILRFETWDGINHDNPGARIEVTRQLADLPGSLLVFVRYSEHHTYQNEWVWNAADIDASRVVYARDLGALENKKLIRYYPARRILLLEPDGAKPKISDYYSE